MQYVGDEYDKAAFRAMFACEWAGLSGCRIAQQNRDLLEENRRLRERLRELGEDVAGDPPGPIAEVEAIEAVGKLIQDGIVHQKAQLIRLAVRHRAGIELGPNDVVHFGFDGAPRVPVLIWGPEAEDLGLSESLALDSEDASGIMALEDTGADH